MKRVAFSFRLMSLVMLSALACLSSIVPTQAATPEASARGDSAQQAREQVDQLEKPMYSPFIERYVLDELKQLRKDMADQRADLIEKVVDKELKVADKSMTYATDTVTYFFYVITAGVSLMLLVGWNSIRDVKQRIKDIADQEISRITEEYEARLQDVENQLRQKSKTISQNKVEIEKTQEIHSLWLRAEQDINPQGKIEIYDQILSLRPNDAEVLTYKADAALALEEPQWAISLCNRAIALDQNYAHAYYQRSCAYVMREMLDQAMSDLEQALLLAPSLRDHAMADECFDPIRDQEVFLTLINRDNDFEISAA